MNILFLDFDGVVNTPYWDLETRDTRMNLPCDGAVSNREACQWVEAFCQIYNFKIVVTSDWRLDKNWRQCLINGGLMDSLLIFDRTIHLPPTAANYGRGHEIQMWLDEHPEVENFLILDDDVSEMLSEHTRHILQPDPEIGFCEWLYCQAIDKFYAGELKNE